MYGLAGIAASFAAYFGYAVGKPVYSEYQSSFAAKEFKQYGVAGTYEKHFFSFLGRLHNLASLEQENEALQSRLARLEKEAVLHESAQAERDLASLNEQLEMKLKSETGSSEARIPQGLTYEVPEHLNHNQLYTLALGYFRKQEYEKSAVIFTYLIGLPDDHAFQRAENYLMNAISWFNLKDYLRASKLVAEAQKRSQKTNPVHRKAILWQAMVEKALGKEKLAQSTLLYFLGQYPHSEETQMINGKRKPAQADAHDANAHQNNPYEAVIADAKSRASEHEKSKKENHEVKETESHEAQVHSHE